MGFWKIILICFFIFCLFWEFIGRFWNRICFLFGFFIFIISLVIVDFFELLWFIIEVYCLVGIENEMWFNVKVVLFWYWNDIFLNLMIGFDLFILIIFNIFILLNIL